ncbi:MAG: glycoside hydrolase family 43 protein [Spirochaetales bacterium]|nr:glycoside hydrolase family 43 protein [Spirochaetales bacterium]
MTKLKIENPVLPGFHPDPSIVRVGDDYYIATSTFEWFPGVAIHHSKDLVHWQLVARPLNRLSQLNMIGEECSCGVWAPCLSYHEGVYYLVYTNMKNKRGAFKDMKNYLVTGTDIQGDWSEPVFLNSSGFDPSLFHDTDGRHYLVNMLCDHTKEMNQKERFGGILLQEFSVKDKKLVGPIINIFKGTELAKTEGPHLYKIKDHYYLICAEGGTGKDHAVTLARSKNLFGPYEVCPHNPVLSSKNKAKLPLQRAGHADIVETSDGQWYMVHLCSRPLAKSGRSILGRETAIQKIQWDDQGWFSLVTEKSEPEIRVDAPNLEPCPWPPLAQRDDFDSPSLSLVYQTLREPLGESVLSLSERPGFLRLKGQYSPSSHYTQALIARRQQAFCYCARTYLEFSPLNLQQMAGIIALYDNENYYYPHLTWDENLGKCLKIAVSDDGNYSYEAEAVAIAQKGLHLEIAVKQEDLTIAYSLDGANWNKINRLFDASILSDEYGKISYFTGAFIGLCAQDLSGTALAADFDYFEYIEGPEQN